MSTVVVSDTSPIRALEHLELLSLLEQLFDEVLIPPAVVDELESPTSGLKQIPIITIPMVRVQAPTDIARIGQLRTTLDPGESEALTLALEIGTVAVLIDEAAGRAEALRLGLEPLGVLGLLVRAKTRGLIGDIEPLIDRLRREINFHVSAAVCDEALRLAGEK